MPGKARSLLLLQRRRRLQAARRRRRRRRQSQVLLAFGGVGRQASHKDLARLGLLLLRHRLLGIDLQRGHTAGTAAEAAGGGSGFDIVDCGTPVRQTLAAPLACSLPFRGGDACGCAALRQRQHLAAVNDVNVLDDGIGRLWGGEGDKAKAAGSPRLAVPHHHLRAWAWLVGR